MASQILSHSFKSNLKDIPELIMGALERAGVGGVFEATPEDDWEGIYFPARRQGKYWNPQLRGWRIGNRVAWEQAQCLREQGKSVILISKLAPSTLAVLLHEFGHHLSELSGKARREYPSASLKRLAGATFRSHQWSRSMEEIIAESIGRLLGRVKLPARLNHLAKTVIRESGVSLTVPLINAPSLFVSSEIILSNDSNSKPVREWMS